MTYVSSCHGAPVYSYHEGGGVGKTDIYCLTCHKLTEVISKEEFELKACDNARDSYNGNQGGE